MSLRGCEQLELRQVFAVDPFPSVQSISLTGSTPTAANSISWAVTFSESVTGVDVSDFAPVLSSGLTAAPLLTVTGSGTSYTVTANTVAGSGTIGLNLVDDGTIRDGTNNPLTSQNAPASYAGQVAFSAGIGPASVATGDVNGDGKPDLVIANQFGTSVSVLLNTTAPGATAPSYAAQATFATGSQPLSVAIGDLNGDGKPDLAIANYYSSTVSVLLNTTANNATAPSYAAQATFATGTRPKSVAIGDLSGDGKPDLAVANFLSSSVSVLWNTTADNATTPTYAAQSSLSTGYQANAVSIGDLNADGRPDLVIASPPSSISVFLNMTLPGATAPSYATQAVLAAGTTPDSFSIGDFNGDGKPDLAIVNGSYTGTVSVLLNTTAQNATTPSYGGQATFATGHGPVSVTTGDFNADGRPDLAIANRDGDSVSVLLNTTATNATTASYAALTTFTTGTSPRSVAVGDFNGDGWPDVAVANFLSSSVSVLLNNLTGSFTGAVATVDQIRPSVQSINLVGASPTNATSISWTVTFSEPVSGVDASDFAIAASGATSAPLLTVTGSGTTYTVTASQVSATGTLGLNLVDNGTIRDQANNLLSGGSFTGAVATVDQTLPSVQSISLTGSSPTNASSVSWAVTFSEPVTGVDAGDFQLALSGLTTALPLIVTGSGTSYTVTANQVSGSGTIGLNLVDNGTIRDQVNNPMANASAGFAAQATFATGDSPYSVAIGDLNGDGKPDLAIANSNSGFVSVLLNTTAQGATAPSYAAQATFQGVSEAVSVAIGDFNSDGRPDLATADYYYGSVSLFLNKTGAGATSPSFQSGSISNNADGPWSVAIGDFNGDGKPDLAIAFAGSNAAVAVILNKTAPGVTSPSFATQATFATGARPQSVAVGDFNGDGKPDLAIANTDSNSVSVLLNTTAPGATAPSYDTQTTFATGTSPGSVAIGDFNGDGRPDLVIANYNSNSVSVFLNTTAPGATTPSYAAQVTFATGSGPTAVSIGDFNGDGKPDLAITNYASSVSVLLNTTAPGATTPSYADQATFASGSGSQSVAIGDFNGDGRPDLAIANAGSNSVSVLLNNLTGNFTGPVATVDQIRPSVQSISIVGTPPKNATSISWTVTFSEPVTGVDAGDFALAASGVTAALPLTVTGSGTTYTVTASQISGAGTLGLSLVDDGTIRDQVDNPPNGGFTGAVATVDTIRPFVQSISLTGPSATTASSISWAVTFSEPVTGVDVGDFQLSLVNLTAAQPLTMTGSGTSYTVTATQVSGMVGKIGLNLVDNGTIFDQAGNRLATASGAASYDPPATFAVGSVPYGLLIGDFNADGRPDLVTVNFYDGNVSVLLNTTAPGATTPSYADQATFASGSGSQSVAIGDFNGDGSPDLAIVNESANTVSVLLNATAPNATAPSFAAQAAFATGDDPRSVAVGDFNGDGRPDLAIANTQADSVSVLLNTTAQGATAPSFATQATIATGDYPTSVSIGDLNGDGKPDLAITDNNLSGAGVVSVFLNTTASNAVTPSFRPQATFAAGDSPHFVLIDDFNADGRPDLAIANTQADSVSVLLNTTAQGATVPSFAAQATFAAGTTTSSVSIGDLNGDGRPDFVTANYFGNPVSVLLNSTVQGATTPAFATQAAFATGSLPTAVAIGDFNSDGKPDLAIANRGGDSVSVLLAGQTGSFAGAVATVDKLLPSVLSIGLVGSPVTNATSISWTVTFSEPVTGVGTGDFQTVLSGVTAGAIEVTGSGSTYTVTATNVSRTAGTIGLKLVDDGSIHDQAGNTLLNPNNPASYATQATFAAGSTPVSVSIGDFNADGKPDLAIVGGRSLSVLLNTTAPGATVPSYAAQATFATGEGAQSVSIGDLNGDGRPDLVIANYNSNSVSVLLNKTAAGATAPSFATQTTFATGLGPFSVSIGDLNGDGRPDLAIANFYDNTVGVFLSTTATGATVPSFLNQDTVAAGGGPISVVIGDVNGDGSPDLAIANYNSNSVSVFLNNTAQGATAPSYGGQATFATGTTPYSVSIGDLNGDGRPDLAIANYGSGTVSVLLNTTGTAATTPSYADQATFAAGSHPISVAIGDLTTDERADLAVANRGSSTASVLVNNMAWGAAKASFDPQATFATGTSPRSVAIGDSNRDGRPDLAVVNGGTSSVSVLLGNQSGSFTGAVATVDVAPTDLSVSPAAVPENSNKGTLVGTLSSTDAYQSDTFTYSLVSGAGSADNASFAIVGDQLKTNAVFDYETKNSYSIRVRTTDSFGQWFEKPLTISVTNVLEGAPVFSSQSPGYVAENAPAGTPIYTAMASYGDTSTPNNKITYSIDATSADAALVSIDPETGVVTLKNSANYEAKPAYGFTVVATDAGNRSTSKQVEVFVEDINEFAPVFSSGATGVVAEGAPTTTAIYTALAIDADGVPHDQITYSIKPGLFDAAAVTIDPTTGAVTLLNSASLSGKSSYTFVVVATDGGTPANATEQGVTVTVTEQNLRTPVFTSVGTGTVAEMSPTSTVLYTAAATDADSSAPNNVVHYSIKPVADADLVTIDPQTGAVTLKAAADYETKSSYSFTVIATDGGNPANSAGQAVTIAVTNVAPTAGSVSTALGFFKAGDTIFVRVTFNEAVFVTGLPQIALTVGSTVQQAVYSSGSGAAVLWFSHTIAAGENDSDGVAVGELTLPGGATIKDGTGVDATTSASNVVATPPSYTSGVVVDTIQPVLQGVTGPSPGTYASGQKLSFTVTFSEPAIVTGVPYLDLKVNGVARRAVFDSAAGTNQLVFSYTVAVGETAAAGKVVATGRSIQLPAGAAVTDRARNAAVSLAYTPPGTSGVKVDGVVPVAASVTAPAAKTYREGQALVFKVNYSRAVYVNGTPQLTVSIGGVFRQAAYIGGAGTKILSFRYLVATGDLSVQRVVLGSTVGLSGGWIRDAVGNNARLTLPAANTNGVLVDAVSPTITGLTIPAPGTYKKGQTLSFTVTFSEPMVVTGSPKLQAVIGSTIRNIAYVRGTGTRSLVFSYTLQASDHDADGIALGQIVLGTGTIRDRAGNPPTSLTLPVVDTSGVRVS